MFLFSPASDPEEGCLSSEEGLSIKDFLCATEMRDEGGEQGVDRQIFRQIDE